MLKSTQRTSESGPFRTMKNYGGVSFRRVTMAKEVNCCSSAGKRLVEEELEQENQNTRWDYK